MLEAVEVVAAVGPHVVWAALLVWVLNCLGWKRIRDFVTRVNAVEVGAVRIEIESDLESAAVERGVEVASLEKTTVAERLRVAQPRLALTRCLWIDDHPEWNRAEIGILNGLGAKIDLARCDDEARQRLKGAVYDIVLSDISRGESDDAGIRFLPEVRNAMLSPPLIFYTRESKGTPPGAFGIAIQPDKLMHLIVDALEGRGR